MDLDRNFEDFYSILYLGLPESGVSQSFESLYRLLPEENQGEKQDQKDSLPSFWIKGIPSEESQFEIICMETTPDDFDSNLDFFSRISGIVFVADSREEHLEANQKIREKVENALQDCGIELVDLSWVFQYKATGEEGVSLEDMEESLNPRGHFFVEVQDLESPAIEEPFRRLAQNILEATLSIENEILDAPLPESSVEMEVAFDPGSLPIISSEEAIEKLQTEGELEGVAVERLDFSSQKFPESVLIRACRIGHWNSTGAVFHDKLELRDINFVHDAIFSSIEDPFRIEGDLTVAHSQFHGEANFAGLVGLESVRFLYTEIKKGTLSFHRALIHGNLEVTDCSLHKGDFRNLLVEKQARFDPTYFSGPANFHKARFHSTVIFTSSTFEGFARFRETHFRGFVDFSGTDFQDEAYFANSNFKSAVEFFKTCFGGPANFLRCDFGEFTRFRQVRFEADSVWSGVRVEKLLLFEEAEFEFTANFQEGLFSKIEFQNVKFRRDADFTSSIFQGSANFHESHFKGNVYFNYCQFQKRGDFKGTLFQDGVSLMGMEGNLMAIRRSQVEGRLIAEREGNWRETSWEYKRLKKIFEDVQAHDDAEWAYYHFKVAQRKAINLDPHRPDRWLKRFFDWLILDLGTGYGTKPSSLLWAAWGIILLFAGLYGGLCADDFTSLTGEEKLGWGQALGISLSAFATNGTLGWIPDSNSPAFFLTAIESILGLFAMILFAVTFMRKMMR